MSDLSELELFVRVVEAGSFAGAADQLGISRSYASKLLARLESRLGVQLLIRTTRSVTPTDAGRAFYTSCAPLLEGLAEAEARVAEARAAPRGALRVAAPLVFGLRYVAPAALDFLERYPEIRLHIDYSDRYVDLVEEGYDLAIRGGDLQDSSLRARRLAPLTFSVAASPDYLARRGAPAHPRDLAEHDCLCYVHRRVQDTWRFTRGSGPETEELSIKVGGPLVCSNADALVEAACRGLGVVMQPDFAAWEALASGRLVPLFEGWRIDEGSRAALWAVHTHTRHVPTRVRLFVQHLTAALSSPPWAQSPV